MMNFMRKSKGSISIFLCLILLPMITYSSMIIDASRVQSARSTIASAGDLSMNAALSEYEQVLQDMYGLFATVESEEELEPALKAYFQQTLAGTLTSTDDTAYIESMADGLSDLVFGAGDGEAVDPTNLIEMQIEDFDYTNIKGSAVANPAVMKRQIIDYMKYKGPVSLATTLFSKLSFLKNSDKQTEVVKKKVEYTKSLNTIQEACEAAYRAIDGDDSTDGYNDYAIMFNDEANQYYDLKGILEKSKANYSRMSQSYMYISKNPYPDEHLQYDDLKNRANEKGYIKNYSSIYNMSTNTTAECQSKLDRLAGELSSIVNLDGSGNGSFERDYGNTHNYYLDYNNTSPDDYNYTYQDIHNTYMDMNLNFTAYQTAGEGSDWYVSKINMDDEQMMLALRKRFNKQLDFKNNFDTVAKFAGYFENFTALQSKYSGAFSSYETKFTDDFNSNFETQYKNDHSESAYKEAYLASHKDETDADAQAAYNSEMNSARTTALADEKANNATFKKYNTYNTRASQLVVGNPDDLNEITNQPRGGFNGYKKQFESLLGEMSDHFLYQIIAEFYAKEAWNKLNSSYQIVRNLKDTSTTVLSCLNDVLTKITEAEGKREEWNTSINHVDEGATRTSMQSDHDTMSDGLKKEDVEKLVAVAEEINTHFTGLLANLEATTFLGEAILSPSITSAPLFSYEKQQYNGDYPNENINGDLINSYVGGKMNEWFVCPVDITVSHKARVIDGLNDADTNQTDPNEQFYLTLKSICEPKGKQDLSDDDQNLVDGINNAVDAGDDTSSDSSGGGGEGGEESGGEEEGGGEEGDTSTSDYLAAILADIKTLLDEGNEGPSEEGGTTSAKVKTDSDDYSAEGDAATDSLSAATGILSKISGIMTTARDYTYMEEYFTEMFTCQTDNPKNVPDANFMPLSGNAGVNLLNKETDWYGKEIEYIIWGGSNVNSNLVKNEAMIYTIRFALNAIYAFTAADIQAFALQVATAIAGWTVVGVPIVQACITVAIALAESAYDLRLLKKGEDVVIYKNAATFVCSPTGALKEIGTSLAEEAINKASEYAAKKIDEALDGIASKVDETIGQNIDAVNDQINIFISEQTDTLTSTIENMFINPIINKAMPILNQVDSGATTLHTLVEDAVNEAFATIEKNIGDMSSGVVYELASLAFENVVKPGQNTLIEELETYFTNVDNVTNPQSIRDMLTGTDGIITGWMRTVKISIERKTSEMATDMKQRISDMSGEAVSKVKGIVHEEMSKVANQVSGTITDTISSTISDYTSGIVDKAVDASSASGGFTLNYKEYCKIFVFLNIVADETKMLQRAATLIQANVQNANENANTDFAMTKAYTLVGINANIKLGTLFPWCVSVEDNLATGEAGTSLDLSHLGSNYITIKYSAINGY